MPINPDNLTPATPDVAGMTLRHIRDVHLVCQQRNTFLFVRPSTAATMRLIDQGFATKSMDIHDKSSDWGLTSGFVPVDQAFNKNLSGTPNPDIHPHGHGEAQPVQLAFTNGQFSKLWALKHFEHTVEDHLPQPMGFRAFSSTRNLDVQFMLGVMTGKVFWRWKHKEDAPLVPVYVWGYGGVPVTGDYDLWMVVPHVSVLKDRKEILSVKDTHGRSAATQFIVELIGHLNNGCARAEKPVFNHGAEAQNFSFTQAMDKHLGVFTPGRLRPFMFPRTLLPGLLHDLIRHGYVVVRNPKWKDGVTLGIEDMANAPEEFAGDGSVKAGKKAMDELQRSTMKSLLMKNPNSKLAQSLKKAVEKKTELPAPEFTSKDGKLWADRLLTLQAFRRLNKIPEDQKENLILPDVAFPVSGPGSEAELYQIAKAYGEEMERRFGRTGFVNEDGHLMPVDQSNTSSHKGEFEQLKQAYLKEAEKV